MLLRNLKKSIARKFWLNPALKTLGFSLKAFIHQLLKRSLNQLLNMIYTRKQKLVTTRWLMICRVSTIMLSSIMWVSWDAFKSLELVVMISLIRVSATGLLWHFLKKQRIPLRIPRHSQKISKRRKQIQKRFKLKSRNSKRRWSRKSRFHSSKNLSKIHKKSKSHNRRQNLPLKRLLLRFSRYLNPHKDLKLKAMYQLQAHLRCKCHKMRSRSSLNINKMKKEFHN